MTMLMLVPMLLTAAPADVKTMASDDDWHTMSITGVAPVGASGDPLYLQVTTNALDRSSGHASEAFVKLTCDGAILTSASILMERQKGGGASVGKPNMGSRRMTMRWSAATPQLSAIKPTYDVKTIKGKRLSASAEGWQTISLSNADGLCPATYAAARQDFGPVQADKH